MKLKKLIIDNFRNITHVEYDLQKINIFAGMNELGKTNTILAVYWCLTDYMLDRSSDSMSIKPLTDTRKEVAVELIFEEDSGQEFKVKKTYAENWVKTRGSEEETLKGHETVLYINDSKVPLQKGRTELREKLLGTADKEYTSNGFDLLRAVIDPYYIGVICDWKELRKFIIAIIGDVSNDEVFAQAPSVLPIKDRLSLDNFDTSKSVKYYRQQIVKCKETISDYESQIKGLETIKDVTPEAIKEAQAEIEKLDQMINDVKAGNGRQSIVADLEGKLASKKMELSKSMQKDMMELQSQNAAINLQIDPLKKQLMEFEEEVRNKKTAYENILNQQNSFLRQQENVKNQTELYDSDVKRLREEYERLAASEFNGDITIPEATSCPACGYVLNSDVLESIQKQIEDNRNKWEEDKQKKLNNIIAMANEKKANIENQKLKLQEIETVLASLKNQVLMFNAAIDDLAHKVSKQQFEINRLEAQKNHEFTSSSTVALQIEVDKLNEQLAQERSNAASNDSAAVIVELRAKKEVHNQVLAQLNSYVTAQEQIKKINMMADKAASNQIEHEQSLILIEKFIQSKLSLFKDRISSVFGDRVKFTLIKTNLKEGSWEEVCFPSVLDKSTPFEKGSGSEQILTGIYLSECIRKKIGLQNLPYIFDECEKLDDVSLSKIETDSQIITSQVNSSYNQVTLVTK